MTVRILLGDVRDRLKELPSDSVDCVVTSPPYWGLRDYGTGQWLGGDPNCAHRSPTMRDGRNEERAKLAGSAATNMAQNILAHNSACGKCGAVKEDSQLGLEPTWQGHVAAMVEVFSEVRRVLKPTGTLWLNYGDSYATSVNGRSAADTKATGNDDRTFRDKPFSTVQGVLKPKDLCGIPWRVALALQAPQYLGKITRVEDRIWLAAMIDGEGCMFIHKRHAGTENHSSYTKKDGSISRYSRTLDNYGAGLEVANTSEAIVRRCMEITGAGSICRQDKDRRQPLFRWNLRSNECRWVVEEIYPHLVGKQHQARLLLGCPSTGDLAVKAHRGLIALHNGQSCDLDFPAPNPLFGPGWYLRQDIIWSKLNPMPESIKDRCTKAHEYVFLLTKSARYYFDAEAIREEQSGGSEWCGNSPVKPPRKGVGDPGGARPRLLNAQLSTTRNKRSVWEVATQPFSEAHFATFPPALIEPCILAGSPKGGLVLDPFGGAGTTGLVADRLGRNAILIELNPEYAEIARRRLTNDAGMFAQVAAE